MSALLEVNGLTAGYGPVEIVRDLSFEVAPGEVVALLGPNGAGKTTTMLTVSGELPPLAGEVVLFGTPARSALHLRVRQGLGVITEDRCVLMQLTVAENLRVGRGDSELALRVFPELTPHLDRKVGLLSGGQQQMLALARALSFSPRLLLADELSLGLAPLIVQRLLRAVRESADAGVGVLLVEQHVHQALGIADRVLVMNHGHLVLQGAAAELRTDIDRIKRAYLTGAGEMSAQVPSR